MKKVFVFLAITAVMAVAAYLVVVEFDLFDLGFGQGRTLVTPVGQFPGGNNAPAATEPAGQTPAQGQQEPVPGGTADANGIGEGGATAMLIEIYESRILFGDEEVTLEELEEILQQYAEYVWELRDLHQASASVYYSVVELLNQHGIAFREL